MPSKPCTDNQKMKIPAKGATSPQRPSYLGAAAAPPVATGVPLPLPVSHYYMTPDMAGAALVAGYPPDGLTRRTIPGTLGFIYTPNDTYLFVDPDNGVFLPKLAWTPVASGLESYGHYGNSVLFAPQYLDPQKLDPDTYKAIFGANKPNLAQQEAFGFPLSAAQAAAQQAGQNGNIVNVAALLAQQPASGFTPYLPGLSPGGPGGFTPYKPGGFPAPAQSGSSQPPLIDTTPGGSTTKGDESSGSTVGIALLALAVVGAGVYAATRR